MNKITLNPQQADALLHVQEFHKYGRSWGYLISGYAGVGKTTMIQQILDEVGNAILMAPTNKAALVLSEKTGHKAATIHKSIYHVDERTGRFIKNPDFPQYSFVIVDESSMLSESLLSDLHEVVVDWGNGKILFLGDPFQLPPVGKAGQTVFQRFTGPSCSLLTQVMRQEGGSSILDIATAMRNVKKTFIPVASKNDVEVANYKTVMKEYIAALREGKDATMVTWTNKKRLAVNAYCRYALGFCRKGEEFIVPPKKGEILMGISNGAVYVNGEVFKLQTETELVQLLEVSYRKFDLETRGFKLAYEKAMCIKDENDGKYLVFPETMEATIAHQSIANAEDLPKGWFTYERGKYHLSENVSICTFGYSITAHKSQGSQWDEVYIYQCSTMSDAARWLYTAITRAAKKLIIRDDVANKMSWDDISKAAAIQPSLEQSQAQNQQSTVSKVRYGMNAKDIIKGMNIDF